MALLRSVALALIFLLAACTRVDTHSGGGTPAGESSAAQNAHAAEEGGSGHAASSGEEHASQEVQVEDFMFSAVPGGARIITGELYNPTDRVIRNAQVQVSLFDADNRRVGTMNISVQNIDSHTRKPFRQAVDAEEDVQGARVRGVLVQ